MITLAKRIDLSKSQAAHALHAQGVAPNSAQVVVALDASKSMYPQYKGGQIQQLLERLMGFAMAMDVDGAFDLYLFGNEAVKLKPLTEASIDGYVQREIMGSHKINQSTRYAPAIEAIHHEFFATKTPVLVIFITDGDATDKKHTQAWITQVCRQPYFWAFAGIGHESFAFLEKLDDLPNRPVDNAGFFEAKDLEQISDSEFFSSVLAEYPQWLSKC